MPFSRRDTLEMLATISLTAAGTAMPARQAAAATTPAGKKIADPRIGSLEFDLGLPTPAMVAKLYDMMDFQRAVQCYLWAMPIVGMESAKAALAANAGAGNGDLVLIDGYRGVSTMMGSNLTTPYVFAFFDLVNGPMVFEYPAGATAGSLIDWWDRPIADVGVPGVDQGRGAVFVLLGPEQSALGKLPANARVLHSRTRRVLLFARVLEASPARAQSILSAARIYELGNGVGRSPTRLLRYRSEGALTSMSQPRGLPYWERLAEALDGEQVEDRDRFFAAMLRPLGIGKDRPFRPDAREKQFLIDAAMAGEAMAKANAFFKRDPGIRYRPDVRWEYLIPPSFVVEQDVPGGTLFDMRTALFYQVTGMSKAVMTKTPGIGSAYLGLYHDKQGFAFDGAKTYRLRVPPNAPAKLFWSITLYDIETRCLIQNPQQIADRSSRDTLRRNTDGSIEIVMAPMAPPGLEANWIPTVAGRGWYTYFRLFGPLEPYFDRAWPLPDIVQQRT